MHLNQCTNVRVNMYNYSHLLDQTDFNFMHFTNKRIPSSRNWDYKGLPKIKKKLVTFYIRF